MKQLRYAFLILICVSFFTRLQAQTGDFDLSAYQQFLESHKDLSSAQILEMHPAGLFEKNSSSSWESALYHDSLEIEYKLTKDEIFLLQKNGFMVSERLAAQSFGAHFLDIWWRDLPVFISTDALLYAFHFAYDRLLMESEKGVLIEKISYFLMTMHQKLPDLAARYTANAEMRRMLRDVDIYLTVPLQLLGQQIPANYSENDSEIAGILDLIAAETYDIYPFFSENCKEIDFSQFKPRGHYTKDEQLMNYFRAMMWLGRIELYLLAPQSAAPVASCLPQSFADIQRQTIDAALIYELMDLAAVSELYTDIEEIISFFVGEQDNVTVFHMQSLLQGTDITSASQLLDSLTVLNFQNNLKEQSFAFQRIQSQLLIRDPFAPGMVQPASAFMLFGQRYVIDSYVSSQVVYDKIIYNNAYICRLFPSTLDILFALGNDAAAQLLVNELDQYKYATNLTALRYLVDSYDESFWTSSIYNMWLSAIKSLNPPENRNLLPSFMRTAGWWQQKMNTQLASWAELRHDNLLYAKPSYTTGIGCSYPYGYVEPIPQFYQRLHLLADKALEKFAGLSFSEDYLKQSVRGYFEHLKTVSDTLARIAQKELDAIPLDSDEQAFIKSMIYQEGSYGGGFIDGWYPKLLYGDQQGILGIDLTSQNCEYVVADFHTTPTDCGGIMMGWVSHAGTGPVDLAIITATVASGQTIAFAGPVSSYHEYRTTGFQRLSDEEWNTTYQVMATRPDWVNLYLADFAGKMRTDGASLVTTLTRSEDSGLTLPTTHLVARNYPNPFNPSTLINFVIPSHLTNSFTELIIYDIQGKVIRHLIAENLPSGNYLTKWNGTNDAASPVASGIYLYQIRVGNDQVTGKMNLLK